ncbi:MAG: nitroreductase [Blautia sp.]|nr:nitroreductase [Blautia sp.]
MSTQMDLIRQRHSVRQYLDKKIPQDVREQLNGFADELNRKAHLHIQILYDEPECFSSRMAHYGKFENADNYIVMAGEKAADLDERCGFYGELLVLKAQELGLNTCWVALTHGKSKAVLAPGEKVVIIIALGYGKTQGGKHKSKSAADVSNISPDAPAWYKNGIEAALLAPTAVNQQKFRFERNGDTITAKAGIIGTCLKIDLGIVKCHFEIGAGKENFKWG